MRGQTNKFFKIVGQDSREIRNKSKFGQDISQTSELDQRKSKKIFVDSITKTTKN